MKKKSTTLMIVLLFGLTFNTTSWSQWNDDTSGWEGPDLSDDNGNGIPDIFENPNGGDNGTTDWVDNNNNGIPDIFEGGNNGGGPGQGELADNNNNGIPDIFEGGNDSITWGGGGGPDLADNNGNGIPDIFEGGNNGGGPGQEGFEDNNNNGIPDIFEGGNDSTIWGGGGGPDLADNNGNGIPDIFEGGNNGGGPGQGGFEDANNNGIPDIFEGGNDSTIWGGGGGPDLVDNNGNGIPDIFEGGNNGGGNGDSTNIILLNNCIDSLFGLLGANGSGWENINWNNLPPFLLEQCGGIDANGNLVDDNGNGIPDIFENGGTDDGSDNGDNDGDDNNDDNDDNGGNVSGGGGAFIIEQGYPNPTSGLINLGVRSDSESQIFINVYTSFGQFVSSRQWHLNPGYNQLQMDLTSDRANGIYHVVVRNNNQSETIRFIVE